jgi:hypothetical protein
LPTNKIFRAVAVVITLLAGAVLARAAALDGTTWKIKLVPNKATAEKGEKELTDTLSFADGMFSSQALLAKGFKSAKYIADIEEKEAEFEVEQHSPTNGLANWLGDVRGTNTAGRLQLIRQDHEPLIYDFEGSKE